MYNGDLGGDGIPTNSLTRIVLLRFHHNWGWREEQQVLRAVYVNREVTDRKQSKSSARKIQMGSLIYSTRRMRQQ